MADGVFDSRKHSAALKIGKMTAETTSIVVVESLLLPYENFWGCASVKFPQVFREYNMEYKHDIISLLEPRVNGTKADNIIAKLGFQCSHLVEAIGYSKGI
ncbi:hypothetical protein CXB51_028595 [Gossypium anomalum]|uniref:Uncharacterized protein n=1 Tax=Gossypium anomalum TaxID=47600 RepID=A0A8J5YH80_9ROSI|nr:hypothetical protein CXB51_028595 [Gossypium anomalum]